MRYPISTFLIALALILLSAPSATYASIIIKPANNLGLIGYWPLNEGNGTVVHDISGNTGSSTSGTFSTNGGTIPTWTTGKFGSAVNFVAANNSYIQMGDINAMDGLTAVTESAWIKSSGTSNNGIEKHWIDKSLCGGGVGDGPFELWKNNGGGDQAAFTIYRVGNTHDQIVGTSNVDDGQWHFVLGEYDGVTASIWVDGVQQNFASLSGTLTSTANTVEIGGDCNSNQFFWNGAEAQVRVYNRALSAGEVATLYKAGAARIASTASLQNSSSNLARGLVGWWPMDAADITTSVLDRSGRGNNGGFVGGATSSALTIGKLGQALKFNGTPTHVVVASSTSLVITSETLSAWVYIPNSIDGNWDTIFEHARNGDGSDYYGLWKSGNANANTFHFRCGGGCFYDFKTVIHPNTWYHVVGTYDTGTGLATMYLNGVLDNTQNAGTGALIAQNNGTVDIGDDDPAGEFFPGTIDDVRIYNRALSAAEVTQLYYLGGRLNAPSPVLTNGSTLTSGLVGHWTFDGPDITTSIVDRSGVGVGGGFAGGSTSSAKTIGKLGQALNFNGSTYIEAGLTTANAIAAGSVTFSAWVKPAQAFFPLSANSQVIMRLGDQPSNNDVTLCFNGCGPSFTTDNGQLEFLLQDSGLNAQLASSSISSWKANTWYFVAGTYDDTAHIAQTYVNGVADGHSLSVIRQNGSGPSTHFRIANHADVPSADGYTGLFQGVIDDPRVYNRALSAAEIKQLYLIGK